MPKEPDYKINGVRTLRGVKRFVRAWRQKGNWIVQIWPGEEPSGEPAADWEMPGVLPLETAVSQSDIQTDYPPQPTKPKKPKPKKRKGA